MAVVVACILLFRPCPSEALNPNHPLLLPSSSSAGMATAAAPPLSLGRRPISLSESPCAAARSPPALWRPSLDAKVVIFITGKHNEQKGYIGLDWWNSDKLRYACVTQIFKILIMETLYLHLSRVFSLSNHYYLLKDIGAKRKELPVHYTKDALRISQLQLRATGSSEESSFTKAMSPSLGSGRSGTPLRTSPLFSCTVAGQSSLFGYPWLLSELSTLSNCSLTHWS